MLKDTSDSEYRVEDRMITVEGGEILVRCLIPTPISGELTRSYPLMVWYHGGGIQLSLLFCRRSKIMFDRLLPGVYTN